MVNEADRLRAYRNNLIQFIDYLHDNRRYMKDDVTAIERAKKIHAKQFSLEPIKENFSNKIEFKGLQKMKKKTVDELSYNNLITTKAKEFGLFHDDPIEIKNSLIPSRHLAYDIKPSEADEITEAKEKYLTFRKETNFCDFLIEKSFFGYLDEALTDFFGAFTDVSDMKRVQPEPLTLEPETEKNSADEIIFNHFNNDDIDDVKEHFRDLEKYMSNGEFIQWIKQAFEVMEPPQKKFQLTGKRKKGEIKALFYNYWKKAGNHGNREEYAKLLSDYFEGFPLKTVLANFNK